MVPQIGDRREAEPEKKGSNLLIVTFIRLILAGHQILKRK